MLPRCPQRVDDASENCHLCGAMSLSRSTWPLCVPLTTHHSAQRCAHVDQGVQAGARWVHNFEASEAPDDSPMIESVTPTPAVTYATPVPVIEHVTPAPGVTYTAPAPVIGYATPAPYVTCTTPAPVTDYVTPSPCD